MPLTGPGQRQRVFQRLAETIDTQKTFTQFIYLSYIWDLMKINWLSKCLCQKINSADFSILFIFLIVSTSEPEHTNLSGYL